ncbi:hypothetical protein POM88_001439 [Heracleum sosnowskyi]|uniref:Uncharacterized protein n=1 Tax=Heracleum sosnowskyi TaxID=360622 RepID=A0AAD8JE65_9APIA|nr:hypothetical protein POM88_001439 [Heracleum sosnowskyi]
MKDYPVATSWTKLYEIGFQVRIRRCISFNHHDSFTPDDQIILQDIGGNLLLQNVDTKKFDHLNIPEPRFMEFAPYKDSLFFLAQKNDERSKEDSSKVVDSVVHQEGISGCGEKTEDKMKPCI